MKMSAPRVIASLVLAALPAVVSGCQRDGSAHARGTVAEGGLAIVDVPTERYVPEPVAGGGAVVGAVTFAAAAPQATTVTVTRDENVCGATIRHGGAEVDGDRVRGALVWLADIRRGRQLPLARRFELVQRECVFSPRVQAVVAGGALNVRSHDAMISRSVVVDVRTLDTLVVLPFTDAGVVVPLAAPLRQPAMLRVSSTTHPWIEAWVAVLDHPYFAESGEAGEFRIEEIPPGQYELRAWHPEFGVTSARITVRPAATDTVELRFGETADAGTGQPALRGAATK